MLVLNVGGGGSRNLPDVYRGWRQDLLDIDPNVKPDIVCDAKKLRSLPPAKYDAVYCSHNLEHFYKHDVPVVLEGFKHVLKPTGHAHIVVPDMSALFKAVQGKDINDEWYKAVGGGKVTFHDVLYGWHVPMAQGNEYYAHKCGFTEKSLAEELLQAGFPAVHTATDGFGNLYAYAFKRKPSKADLRRIGV